MNELSLRLPLIATLLSILPGIALGAAGECEVAAYALPDAERMDKIRRDRDAFLQASIARPRQLGVSRPAEIPKAGPPAVAGSSAGGAGTPRASADPFAGLTKEITVEHEGHTVRLRVPINLREQEARAAFRESQAWRAARSPLTVAIEAGDVAQVNELIAAGVDVAEIDIGKPGQKSGSLLWAAQNWHSQNSRAGGDPRKEQEVADRYRAIIKALVAAGADVRATYDGATVYSWLPISKIDGRRAPGSIEVVSFLLKHGAPLVTSKSPWRGLLSGVSARGDLELLELLLRDGNPSLEVRNEALFSAALALRWDAAIRLLESGADPNAKVTTLNRPVGSLFEVMHLHATTRPFLKVLLRYKANPNVVLTSGSTPLMSVIHDHELMEAFLEAGADPNWTRTVDGWTALHFATAVANPPGSYSDALMPNAHPDTRAKSVALLLSHGTNPDLPNHRGITPIMQTTELDGQVINLLLDAGASRIDAKAAAGRPERQGDQPGKQLRGPVVWALLQLNERLAIAWLRARGLTDPGDCGALYYAAASGQVEALKALVEMSKGARVVFSKEGDTMLHATAAGGHRAAIQLLLERGVVSIEERTRRRGNGPPEALSEDLLRELRRVFPDRAAILEAEVETGGETALMTAVRWGRSDIARLLIERGADVNALDNGGRTTLDHARASPRGRAQDVMEILVRAGATPGPKARIR